MAATNQLKPSSGSDPRFRSFSIAGPLTEAQRAAGYKPGPRRLSRALDVKPGVKSQIPVWRWIQDNVDKQLLGLGINFVILLVLLILLKVFVQWTQLAQHTIQGDK